MGRCSDKVSGGRRFDSRRAQTTFLGPLRNEFVCIFTYVGDGLGTFLGLGREGFMVGSARFLVGSGSLFRQIWDVLGCVWEWPGSVFGWVWDGLGKNVRRGRKMKVFKNGREYFS